ncbi:hypothetical protein NMY22_g13112 [Coprinellus aureogranulatus]|nr:hypothetical protein NMY22_g13112 [Coprinellus aureogranulatus]
MVSFFCFRLLSPMGLTIVIPPYLGLQKATTVLGQSSLQRILAIACEMWRTEGVASFHKGITPRVLCVAPGQATVFAVYEDGKGTSGVGSRGGLADRCVEIEIEGHRLPTPSSVASIRTSYRSCCVQNADESACVAWYTQNGSIFSKRVCMSESLLDSGYYVGLRGMTPDWCSEKEMSKECRVRQGAAFAAVLPALLEKPHTHPEFLVDGQPVHPPLYVIPYLLRSSSAFGPILTSYHGKELWRKFLAAFLKNPAGQRASPGSADAGASPSAPTSAVNSIAGSRSETPTAPEGSA